MVPYLLIPYVFCFCLLFSGSNNVYTVRGWQDEDKSCVPSSLLSMPLFLFDNLLFFIISLIGAPPPPRACLFFFFHELLFAVRTYCCMHRGLCFCLFFPGRRESTRFVKRCYVTVSYRKVTLRGETLRHACLRSPPSKRLPSWPAFNAQHESQGVGSIKGRE